MHDYVQFRQATLKTPRFVDHNIRTDAHTHL